MSTRFIPRLEGASNPTVETERWVAGMAFAPFGVRVGIRTNDSRLLEPIKDLMLPGWRCADSEQVDHLHSVIAEGDTYRLVLGPRTLGSECTLEEVLELLDQSIHIQIGAYAREHVFVHAGVVGWSGGAVVLPGRTRAGKSTLVKSLVDAGAVYYSDEFAVIDSQGLIQPYPKPLSLRHPDPSLAPCRVPAWALGWHEGLEPLPVLAIVLTEFRPNAIWKPLRVTPGQGVLRLYANTVGAQINPELAVRTLAKVASAASIYAGPRGEAGPTVSSILSLLAQKPAR